MRGDCSSAGRAGHTLYFIYIKKNKTSLYMQRLNNETCHKQIRKQRKTKLTCRTVSQVLISPITVTCSLHLYRTVVVLNAWRYRQSSGVELQYPTRGSFSALMITKSYWKVPLPLGEHKQGLALSPCGLLKLEMLTLEIKSVILFWARGESKANRSVITWFAQVKSRIHTHHSILVIR